MKIVLALDSFKGSLSSSEAAMCAREGILRVCPQAEIKVVPVADGGEGTIEALACGENARKVSISVHGPLGEPLMADDAVMGNAIAVVELAKACGLPLVPAALRNPEKTSTFGMGEQIRHAIDGGARRFLLGIGGSATNDGGMGLLQALGWRFLDENGNALAPCGEILARIREIDAAQADGRLKDCVFEVACDVDNPLCGPNGAAHVYAPQKGATPAQVLSLDEGLRHFGALTEKTTGVCVLEYPGAGAAGGVGAACLAFLKARLRRGIDCVLDAVNFDSCLNGADWVVTGEGRLDRQSLMGKTPQGVASRAQKKGIPVVALAGAVEADAAALRRAGIVAAFAIGRGPLPLDLALRP